MHKVKRIIGVIVAIIGFIVLTTLFVAFALSDSTAFLLCYGVLFVIGVLMLIGLFCTCFYIAVKLRKVETVVTKGYNKLSLWVRCLGMSSKISKAETAEAERKRETVEDSMNVVDVDDIVDLLGDDCIHDADDDINE